MNMREINATGRFCNNVINFPLTAEQAWAAYQRLILEVRDEPALADDPDHREARSRAYATFHRIYTEAA